jgi:hypothetical protein
LDTFAFRNDSRIYHRGKPDMYCNRCFLMARAVGQFQRFARFDPDRPRLRPADYTERVRQVTRRGAWRAPLPEARRITFPGFASLHALSREEEAAVKAGLPERFWTLVHWTNWRMTFPSLPGQQERVARETMAEIRAGRPVQLFITDFPRIEVNHSVLAFDYHATAPERLRRLRSQRSGGARRHPLRPARRALPPRSAPGRDRPLLPRLPPVLLADLLGS